MVYDDAGDFYVPEFHDSGSRTYMRWGLDCLERYASTQDLEDLACAEDYLRYVESEPET